MCIKSRLSVYRGESAWRWFIGGSFHHIISSVLYGRASCGWAVRQYRRSTAPGAGSGLTTMNAVCVDLREGSPPAPLFPPKNSASLLSPATERAAIAYLASCLLQGGKDLAAKSTADCNGRQAHLPLLLPCRPYPSLTSRTRPSWVMVMRGWGGERKFPLTKDFSMFRRRSSTFDSPSRYPLSPVVFW